MKDREEETSQNVSSDHIGSSVDAYPLKLPYDNGAKDRAAGVGTNGSNPAEEFGTVNQDRHPGSGQYSMRVQLPEGRISKKFGSSSSGFLKERRMSDGAISGLGLWGRKSYDKGASLPEFGAWDATNPASGEGFTEIFEKARVEKKLGGANSVTLAKSPVRMNAEDDIHMQGYGIRKSSFFSWFCCAGCHGQRDAS